MLSPACNLMISQLKIDKYERLLDSFQLVGLEPGQLIFRPYEAIQFVYFPVTAIIAMEIDISDGTSAEIVLIGKEGMVGSGVMGGNQNFSRARVKFAGLAVTRQMILQIAMPTVCSSRHSNEQQVIRWLMNTLDKTQGEVLQVTHQEIADSLGIRRESVTLTAGKLSQEGLLEISRGQLKVLNRPELEARACECYRVMNPALKH